jgi:DNA-binding HxlR family transcriptional regulator
MKKISRRSMCPISSTLDIVGDKWTLLIVRDLMFDGKKTYGEFLRSREKIATNILADRLQVLETNGIVEKKAFPGNKAKNLYELTPKGIDLLPVLLEIVLWGDKHFDTPDHVHRAAGEIRENKENAIKQISELLLAGGTVPKTE